MKKPKKQSKKKKIIKNKVVQKKNLTAKEKKEINAQKKLDKEKAKRKKMIEMYGDESQRTLSIVKKVRNRSIISWAMVIGIVLLGIMQANFMISDNSKVTPIKSNLVWKKSNLNTTLQSVWVDKNQTGMTIQLKLDEESVSRLPFQGSNYAVFVSQSGVKAGQKFPLVFSRFDTNGQIAQLSIALQGFSKSKPIHVTIASKKTLDKITDNVDSGTSIDASKNVGDMINQLESSPTSSAGKRGWLAKLIKPDDSSAKAPFDFIEFSVIPNYSKNKTINEPIFSYNSDKVATFEPENVLYYLYTKDKIDANNKSIKQLQKQIPTINDVIEQDKARLAANPKDVDATSEANSMQSKLTEINNRILDLKKDIKTIKDIPSSKLVLSPLTEGYTLKN